MFQKKNSSFCCAAMGNTKSSEEEPSKEPRGSVLKDKIKYQNGRRVSKVAKLSR